MPTPEAKLTLEYATPAEPRRALTPWWLAFIFGGGVGYAAVLVLLARPQAAWQEFLMVAAFAPVAVFVDAVPYLHTTLASEVEAGGPLLYGLYGTLLTAGRRHHYAPVVAAVHTVCVGVAFWRSGLS